MQTITKSYITLFISAFLSITMLAVTTENNPASKKGPQKMETRKAVSAKIAIVDIRRMITQDPDALKNSLDEWKDLYAEIQKVLQPAQKEIANLEEQYRSKAAELEQLQASGVSSKDAIRKKYQEDLAPLEFKLDNTYKQFQRYSYEKLGEAQAVLAPKIEEGIDEICDVQGWDFAINKEVIPSKRIKKQFDITDDVARLLNKRYADEKAKRAKAAPGKQTPIKRA